MSKVKKLPPRSAVKPSDCWDLASLFKSDSQWETAFKKWEAEIPRYAEFAGHPAALYIGQIKNFAGQPVAVIEVIQDRLRLGSAERSRVLELLLCLTNVQEYLRHHSVSSVC